MLNGPYQRHGWRRAVACAACAVALLGVACARNHEVLTPPQALRAPYPAQERTPIWAVVPLRNESGTSAVDALTVSDKLVDALGQVEGIRCLPTNRTIEALRVLKINSIRSPAEAEALAKVVGADAVLVGAVTSYDPYTPILGLSVALFGRPGWTTPAQQTLDVRDLSSRPNEAVAQAGNFEKSPLSAVSEVLDGKNHQVMQDLKTYATGRHDPNSAMGWKRYLASMELYTEFAAHHAVERLLTNERARLGIVDPATEGEGKTR